MPEGESKRNRDSTKSGESGLEWRPRLKLKPNTHPPLRIHWVEVDGIVSPVQVDTLSESRQGLLSTKGGVEVSGGGSGTVGSAVFRSFADFPVHVYSTSTSEDGCGTGEPHSAVDTSVTNPSRSPTPT